ncbi:MAG: alanine racemase, partial [Gammaproteobacteria bacterium]
MPRPLTATIHLDAMRHNLARARACAPGANVWAVVKARGYGHGLERASRAFADADGLALIEIDSAAELRARGWTKPVLLLEGIFDAADCARLCELHLASAVHTVEQIELLERADLSAPIDVHLKMNTGMNRLGFKPADFAAAYARLRALPMVRTITLMTHFANSDEVDHARLTMREQVSRFRQGAAGIQAPLSLCNSGAVLHREALGPLLASDWIRPGIMLYGASPGGASAEQFGLLPAMTLASEIIGIQQLAPGDAV